MTKINELNQQLNELDKEIKVAAPNVRLGKVSEDEYSKLYSQRSAVKRELDNVQTEIKRAQDNEKRRVLPDVPKEYLTHKYYFDKKDELEQRENQFKQSFERAAEHVEDVRGKYDTAVLNGADDEISALYDELQQAKKQKDITQSKLKSLQDSTKQQTLEDTAMEVILSRVHVDNMVKEDRERLISRHTKAKQELAAVEKEIQQYNAKYDGKMKDFHKVIFDLGDNSGLGLNLQSKYRKQPAVMMNSQRINID